MMKHRPVFMGLVVALVVVLSLTTAAFASGETNGDTDSKATICVDGYVINHREQPVDGTKMPVPVPGQEDKYRPLVVEAVRINDTAAANEGAYQAEVGSDGYFKFEELPEGDWNFRMQLPPEWEGIVPHVEVGALAETGATTLVEKKGCYRIVFKVRRLIEIVVVKWEEKLDGSVDVGKDWEITATPVDDPFVKPQTEKTDGQGSAFFTLTPGQWVISEKLKSGWVPVTPQKVTLTLDPYSPIGARPNVVFKNRMPPCYNTITVWKLGYGVWETDGTEAQLGPLAGWTITVKSVTNAIMPMTLVTDAEGKAVFKNLPPGVYTVYETMQSGWKLLKDEEDPTAAQTNPVTVTLALDGNKCVKKDVLFKNIEIAGDLSIYGKKLFQAWVAPYKGNLVGLSDWEITATLVGDTSKTLTVKTDALGRYKFEADDLAGAGIGFPGAAVKVCEESRDNWIHVTPECVVVKFPYPVPDTFKGVEVNFTNMEDPPPGGAVAPATTSAGPCVTYYQVAKGDTLAKIAGRYGVSVRGLIAANGIHNADVIYTGQNLCVK